MRTNLQRLCTVVHGSEVVQYPMVNLSDNLQKRIMAISRTNNQAYLRSRSRIVGSLHSHRSLMSDGTWIVRHSMFGSRHAI